MTTGANSCAASLLLILGWAVTSFAQSSGTVPVLFTEDENTSTATLLSRGLRDSLAGSPNVQLEIHHLDYERLGDTQWSEMAEWLQSQYRDRHSRVMVAVADPASEFAVRYGKAIWPDARIVHANVSDARAQAIADRGEPIISRINDDLRIAQQALDLFPDTRQIWLIAGASDRDRQWLAVTAASLAPLGNVRIKEIAGLRWPDVLAQVRSMPADAVAFPVIFFTDANGRSFVPTEAVQEIAQNANRPVFVTQNNIIGTGPTGGYVQDWEDGGRVLGRIVLRLLAGAYDGPRVEIVRGQWIFDAVQLRRWSIPESKLPPGSVVLNAEESIWQRHRQPILATLFLVALQATVIGALLVQRRQRRRVEIALRTSEEDARASERQVRDLAGRLISAREGERARIARDLHDDIGQRVASFSIALSRVKSQIPKAASPVVQSLSDLEEQAMRLSTDLRHLSHELHSATLEHLGLLEALRERCDEFREESGVPVQLDISERWRDVTDAVGLCLYRVTQESLRNVATHARAENVTLRLDRRNGRVTMRVTDDGRGFDQATGSSRSGLGLVSLGERVRMLGGTLDVTSSPGAGTSVTVQLPAGE